MISSKKKAWLSTLGEILRRLCLALFLIAFSSLLPSNAHAATGGANNTSLKPEVLGAKAFLEDLLIRRYSQALGTRLEKGYYTVGAELSLSEIPKAIEVKPPSPEDAPPSDLVLGTLDPEELIKRYASDAEGAQKAQSFLKDYKIKAVLVSVGVKEELGANIKTETEKWLAARIQGEFGKTGKGVVTTVSTPILPKKEITPPAPQATPKAPWERLEQFQQLAGQVALATAILLGAILFALLSKKKGSNSNTVKSLDGEAKDGTPGGKTAASGMSPEDGLKLEERKRKLEDDELATREAREFTTKLTEIMPALTGKYERVIQSWCQAGGEDGRLKVACFSEAVGRSVGKLPIPVDAINEVSRIFATMPSMNIIDKRDVLKKVYWDLLTAMNLGVEAFDKPFDYLNGMNVGVVQQALIEQNPRLKTLVALFMPTKLREDYVKAQSKDAKLALILSAAGLSGIPTDELKSFDETLKTRTLGQSGSGKSMVPLEMSLGKIVSVLSPLDEILLLSEASTGENRNVFDSYKRSSPSLAFLGDWQDEKLMRLFAKTTPDEIVAYLRVMPALTDRFLTLCPPMTAELVADDLRRVDAKSDGDKNRILGEFTQRLMNMIVKNEISLTDVFPPALQVVESPESEGLRNAA